jgi:predicted nucleotidyltransferase
MLEKLFTSKNRIKIMGFLFFETQETHLREISRELKISPSAVKNEVENLIIIGIIKKEKNKITLNQKSIILQDLKSILIKTDFVVYPIKEALKDINAEFIFIFGSFAKGDFTQESDIDLMVIGKIKSDEVYEKIKPAEDTLKREINPSVWRREEFTEKRKTGFIKDILSKKIIMIKGEEDELRKIAK